jgi:hypothetical protein
VAATLSPSRFTPLAPIKVDVTRVAQPESEGELFWRSTSAGGDPLSALTLARHLGDRLRSSDFPWLRVSPAARRADSGRSKPLREGSE